MRGTRLPGGMFGDDIFNSYGESGGSMHQSAPRKAAPIENKLHCSLEELYKGASKRIKISRETFDASGVEGLNQISHGTLRSMSECGASTLRSLVIYGVSL
ncbi:hypothetical protein Peur_024372 [Populus x canadensis]